MQNNNGVNNFWIAFFTIGGIFAIWNIIKAFRKHPVDAREEYEDIIAQKDYIIEEQQRQIRRYQKLLGYDESINNVE